MKRIVSLVPSLTESVAHTEPGLLVGATDWCVHPADLDVTRIRGTKNPDIARIIELAPDLVLANEEENRQPDLDVLQEAGLNVWVTRIRTVPEAFSELNRMLTEACGLSRPEWLSRAEEVWGAQEGVMNRRKAIIPVWRRPWMVVGRDTFTGDVLARLGVDNVYAEHAERYPKMGLDELRAVGADLVVLPDEPYAFTATDGPEAFAPVPSALVSGRHLTWYGPSLAEAPSLLEAQLGDLHRIS